MGAKNKSKLVRELDEFQKTLDIDKLSSQPFHKKSKKWIAGVSGILKNLDETDFQKFEELKNEVYLENVPIGYRASYANKIDLFIRQKIAEYENCDLEGERSKSKNKKEICIPIPEFKLPNWIIKNLREIVIGIICTVSGGLLLYYIFGVR